MKARISVSGYRRILGLMSSVGQRFWKEKEQLIVIIKQLTFYECMTIELIKTSQHSELNVKTHTEFFSRNPKTVKCRTETMAFIYY